MIIGITFRCLRTRGAPIRIRGFPQVNCRDPWCQIFRRREGQNSGSRAIPVSGPRIRRNEGSRQRRRDTVRTPTTAHHRLGRGAASRRGSRGELRTRRSSPSASWSRSQPSVDRSFGRRRRSRTRPRSRRATGNVSRAASPVWRPGRAGSGGQSVEQSCVGLRRAGVPENQGGRVISPASTRGGPSPHQRVASDPTEPRPPRRGSSRCAARTGDHLITKITSG